jgi:hypothetical protein
MTAPGSPWITIYLVPPIYNPVGARVPGSAKSLLIAVISSGLNYNKINKHQQFTYKNGSTKLKTDLLQSHTKISNNYFPQCIIKTT